MNLVPSPNFSFWVKFVFGHRLKSLPFVLKTQRSPSRKRGEAQGASLAGWSLIHLQGGKKEKSGKQTQPTKEAAGRNLGKKEKKKKRGGKEEESYHCEYVQRDHH